MQYKINLFRFLMNFDLNAKGNVFGKNNIFLIAMSSESNEIFLK